MRVPRRNFMDRLPYINTGDPAWLQTMRFLGTYLVITNNAKTVKREVFIR